MEKINNTAVSSMVLSPVATNPLISSTLNPAITAAITGRSINATGGESFSLISTNINTNISANPIIAKRIRVHPPHSFVILLDPEWKRSGKTASIFPDSWHFINLYSWQFWFYFHLSFSEQGSERFSSVLRCCMV